MKNRDYKQFAAGEYYHIYNRGNGKQDIFYDDQDHLNFLKRLKIVLGLTKMPFVRGQRASLSRMQALPNNAFTVVSYCLMPNHFHILLRQNSIVPVSKLLLKVCSSYSKYFNKKYQRVGHLFQDQFKAVHIDNDSHLLWLSAYIHNNPVVSGVVEKLEDYPWSSYLDYIGKRQGTLIGTTIVMEQFSSPEEYAKFVNQSFGEIRRRKDLEAFLLD